MRRERGIIFFIFLLRHYFVITDFQLLCIHISLVNLQRPACRSAISNQELFGHNGLFGTTIF